VACEHEKRSFIVRVEACPECEPERVKALELAALPITYEADLRRPESEGLVSATEVMEAARDFLSLQSPPTEARCRCCNRRLRDRDSIAAGEGPLCREGLCRRKSRAG